MSHDSAETIKPDSHDSPIMHETYALGYRIYPANDRWSAFSVYAPDGTYLGQAEFQHPAWYIAMGHVLSLLLDEEDIGD